MKFSIKKYKYQDRIGNLNAEAVGVVKGKKYFPVFEGNMIFKPLTKSKPFSNPLFAYAEVFWSKVINKYFMEVPEYELAICEGYEAAQERYYDYGTVVPRIYKDGEHLVNLLEYFRKYPDPKVDIDHYINYCQIFYDYTDIFESELFQNNIELSTQLAMHILVSILKGDQNYHYENVAFLCDASNQIICLAPMIDHEFSTYFMFPDDINRNLFWYEELKRGVEGKQAAPNQFASILDPAEREMVEQSPARLHKNLCYIKENFPGVMEKFIEKLDRFEQELEKEAEEFYLQKNSEYPDEVNSDAYLIGKARYKDKDEEKAALYEKRIGGNEKTIDFEFLNTIYIEEIKGIIHKIQTFQTTKQRMENNEF